MSERFPAMVWVLRRVVWAVIGLTGTCLAADGVVRFSSEALQVGVDAGNGRLVELIERGSGHNFASGGAAEATWWSADFETNGVARTVRPREARRVQVEALPAPERGVRVTWSDFPEAGEVRVEVVGRLDAQPGNSAWTIAVNKPAGAVVTQLVFPCVTGGPEQADEFLAVPVWMGERQGAPRAALAGAKKQGTRLAWDYPGRLALQCLTLYRNAGPGLYLACNDAAAFRKTFAARGDGRGGIEFEVVHLPENGARGATRYAPAYAMLLGTFRGDWVTAAERYRGWAQHQAWAKESRVARGQLPAWVQDTALWIWNRGRSGEVLLPAVEMQKKLGLPVSVLWHWWHGCAYDTGFPEYLPPREGTTAFRAAMADAHEHQVRAMVYMNQRLWGLTTPSWQEEAAGRFAVKGRDGTFRPEVYNTFTKQPCVAMCMGTTFWRDKYAGLAEEAIVDLGVDGIYMDQACTALSCYDSTHGHPLGGGAYWMNGFRKLSADIRARSRNVRPIALAGEGTGEAWLPYLDVMLSLEVSRERYAPPSEGKEPIPFFQAVYHRHAIQFGNYSSLTMPPYDDLWPKETAPTEPLRLLDRKYSRQFYHEQARAFVWGQQPMLANFRPSHLEERPEEIAYVMQLVRLRRQGLDYLLRGEWVRPPSLNAPMVETDMSRLSIYAGQQGALSTYKKKLPLALAGAWRAENGNVAVALASIADEPLEVGLTFDPLYHDWATVKQVWRVDESGRKPVTWAKADATLMVALPARGACLIELVR